MTPLEADDHPLRAEAAAAARDLGCELLALAVRRQGSRSRIEVTVDKPGGVTVEDCARVSRRLDAALEDGGLIPDDYVLEVSSPGLDRKLETVEDFDRFRGRLALLQTREPHAGRTRFRGTLEGLGQGGQAVRVAEPEGVVELPLTALAWARLDFDLPGAAGPRAAGRRQAARGERARGPRKGQPR